MAYIGNYDWSKNTDAKGGTGRATSLVLYATGVRTRQEVLAAQRALGVSAHLRPR